MAQTGAVHPVKFPQRVFAEHNYLDAGCIVRAPLDAGRKPPFSWRLRRKKVASAS
jgi:hypothetical protein